MTKEILRDQVQSHIWLTASSYIVKYLRISSYIRKPFLIYDFAPDPIWISLYMGEYNDDIYVALSLVKSPEAAAHRPSGEGEGEHAWGRGQDQPPRLRLLHQLFKGKKMTDYFFPWLINYGS